MHRDPKASIRGCRLRCRRRRVGAKTDREVTKRQRVMVIVVQKRADPGGEIAVMTRKQRLRGGHPSREVHANLHSIRPRTQPRCGVALRGQHDH